MKVAIVTLHRVYNYGSALQAYATQKVFEMTQTCLCVFLELIHLYSLRWWAFQLGGSALGEVPCLGSI